MIRSVHFALVAAALASLLGAAPAPAALDAANNPLYHRMISLNGELRTYRADLHVDVALKTFPFISPSLDGNVFFKRPDKEAVVFQTVPALAAQFKKVYPRIDPPGRWPALYDVTIAEDDQGVTTFRLAPKRNGRVERLEVKVDDSSATIKSYTWTYRDGGYVTFDQTFKSVGGNFLVDKQTGHVELPAYKADVTSNFSNYKLNVAIADSVFEEK